MKTIKHLRKKLKKTLRDGKVPHVHGLAKLILLKLLYYQKQSTGAMKSHQNINDILYKNKIKIVLKFSGRHKNS
jgi:hypothetical protein